MVIINPIDDSVLTLKKEMKMRPYQKYTKFIWEGVVFDNHKQSDTTFVVNLSYDKIIEKLISKKEFIIAQWKEI